MIYYCAYIYALDAGAVITFLSVGYSMYLNVRKQYENLVIPSSLDLQFPSFKASLILKLKYAFEE